MIMVTVIKEFGNSVQPRLTRGPVKRQRGGVRSHTSRSLVWTRSRWLRGSETDGALLSEHSKGKLQSQS